MTSEILNVVIDERKALQAVDTDMLMRMSRHHHKTANSSHRVFKDYLLSSEVFYLDSSLLN